MRKLLIPVAVAAVAAWPAPADATPAGQCHLTWCSKIHNQRNSTGPLRVLRNWGLPSDTTETLPGRDPFRNINGPGDYLNLAPGAATARFQDWDAFRVPAGCQAQKSFPGNNHHYVSRKDRDLWVHVGDSHPDFANDIHLVC
jgi:hypothetical protein